jgi:methylated-DNA-[protein]-cysteine S-methyltransferase
MYGFSLFETAIGNCGIAWGERGIVGVQLPEAGESATRARIRRRFPGATAATPPAEVRGAIRAITRLLRGEPADLSKITLDMEKVPPFHRRVYESARKIGPGKTAAYGDIAKAIGRPGSARAVGQALGRNPFAIVVPCHRILAAGGKLGGFSAEGGVTTKQRMLAIEGAAPESQLSLFPARANGLCFDPRVAVRHVRKADPALARVIDSAGRFQLELQKTASPFAALAEAIVYQQLSGKAAATIYGRVCALLGHASRAPTPEGILHTSDVRLRGAGLSRAKTLALRDLAEKARASTLPSLARIRRMDDEAIVECLTQVRGVGRWTAEMFLIFRLGRPDVLPVDDYGVRKGFALAFGKRTLPSPKALARYGERWRPYRTVASWYLWRALDGAGE